MTNTSVLPTYSTSHQTTTMDATLSLTARTSRALRASSRASSHHHVASGITQPMAIWSLRQQQRRQFSSAQGLSLPPPLSSLGSPGGSSSASYFQRSNRLPTNTIVKFVPQQQAWVVERFGRFNRILEPGLAILIPMVDVSTTLQDGLLVASRAQCFSA